MELREERIGRIALLLASGRVDSTTAPALGEQLGKALGTQIGALVLDLSGLDYISSAGFRALLVANRLAQAKAVALHLCGLSEKLQQLFELAGFLELFAIHAKKAEAIAAASGAGAGAGAASSAAS